MLFPHGGETEVMGVWSDLPQTAMSVGSSRVVAPTLLSGPLSVLSEAMLATCILPPGLWGTWYLGHGYWSLAVWKPWSHACVVLPWLVWHIMCDRYSGKYRSE